MVSQTRGRVRLWLHRSGSGPHAAAALQAYTSLFSPSGSHTLYPPAVWRKSGRQKCTSPGPCTSSALTNRQRRNKSEGLKHISDKISHSRLWYFRLFIKYIIVFIYKTSKLLFNYFRAHSLFLILPSCLAYEIDTSVCLRLTWGQVELWAQLGKMMNNSWEMSRRLPGPRPFCEWGLPAERAPIIKWGQWSQVTWLYDRAWPRGPSGRSFGRR